MPKTANGAEPLGIEATLWAAADKLRGNLESAEYKHVVLGLIFLKYLSDAFAERRAYLAEAVKDPSSDYYIKSPDRYDVVLEDRDNYTSDGVFWVPEAARWNAIQAQAKQPTIGKLLDEAMDAIESENRSLKGVLPKDYGRPGIDKRRLGELVELAKQMKTKQERGEKSGLNEAELAFYDAIRSNDAAVLEMGDDVLKQIALEVVDAVKRNASIDWNLKDQVRAKLRAAVKRVLVNHDYPPDRTDDATLLVLQQAELFFSQLAA